MTEEHTDDIDAMLRSAGERWRSAAPTRTRVSADLVEQNPTPWRAWAMPVVAAAVVVAVTVAVLVARPFGTDHTAPAADNPLRSLVVHDGDRVSATGQIFAAAYGTQLCTNAVTATQGAFAAPLTVPTGPTDGGPDQTSPNPGATACSRFHIADLTGLNVDQRGIGGPHGEEVVFGFGAQVTVTGTYSRGVIAVDTVTSWNGRSALDFSPQPTPCATPAGGWVPAGGTSNFPSASAADAYVHAHRSVVGTSWVSNPSGGALFPNAEGGHSAAQVFTVGVVGGAAAQARVRADLAKVFHGLLCVYPVAHSLADLAAGTQAVTQLLGTALIEVDSNPTIDRQVAHLGVLTDAQAAALQPYVATVAVDPHVRPLR